MADLTATSFGLLIAFLLPGLSFLYALTFWSSNARRLLVSIATLQTNVGLFLFIVLAGCTVGLMLTLVRWFIFEYLWYSRLRKPHRDSKTVALAAEDFLRLSDQNRLAAFRAVAEEHYRYHQFWGGMTIVLPVLSVGWLKIIWNSQNLTVLVLVIAALALLEMLTCYGAAVAYDNYVRRGRSILGEG